MSTKALDDILDIKPELTKAVQEPAVIKDAEPVDEHSLPAETSNTSLAVPAKADTLINDDLTFARNRIKEIISSAQITLESAIAAAEETGNPRAFEVVGTLVQSLVTANKELLTLHKTKADAMKTSAEGSEVAPKTGDVINIEKAVFTGRAQDLLRQLRAAKIEVELES